MTVPIDRSRPIVAVVDYGAGNLASVIKAFAAVGAAPRIAADVSAIEGTDAIVIPGVGHFEATRALDGSWRAVIERRRLDGTPILGICLGMQWLYEGSDEAPLVPGLGIFEGRCIRLAGRALGVKVPHVGWNDVVWNGRPTALGDAAGLTVGGAAGPVAVYFTHTYAAPVTEDTTAITEHGDRFASIVERDGVWGVQFHPEKSGATGLAMLEAFVKLTIERRVTC